MADEKKVAEEKKEEKEEEKKEGEKNEGKKEEEPPEIVLKVDMHCEACARKVARALKGFEGVEEVSADSKASKVVVKGKAADPKKVWERLQKKSSRKVDLISPLPKPPKQNNTEIKEPPKEEKKEKTPPAVITVVLKVRMDCEACAQVIQKRICGIQGVETVETDLANGQVIVKGLVDPTKLVDDVYKRTRKQASIVKEKEKKPEKKEVEEKKAENDNKTDNIKRSEYGPSINYADFGNYTSQIFSDENPNACFVM